jgi:hypothetical protein
MQVWIQRTQEDRVCLSPCALFRPCMQVAVYKGTIPGHPHAYELDDHHRHGPHVRIGPSTHAPALCPCLRRGHRPWHDGTCQRLLSCPCPSRPAHKKGALAYLPCCVTLALDWQVYHQQAHAGVRQHGEHGESRQGPRAEGRRAGAGPRRRGQAADEAANARRGLVGVCSARWCVGCALRCCHGSKP